MRRMTVHDKIKALNEKPKEKEEKEINDYRRNRLYCKINILINLN